MFTFQQFDSQVSGSFLFHLETTTLIKLLSIIFIEVHCPYIL